MKRSRFALSIRAQLLLVLTVFLVLPWLGVEYVRELERVLRDAQERTLAGTAQAVATALHDRPRLFAVPADPIASFARERADASSRGGSSLPPSASPEIAQIIEGLSRTTARIWVIDRDGTVLARAGTLKPPQPDLLPGGFWAQLAHVTVGRLYALVLDQPTTDFSDDAAAQGAPRGRDVEGALAGILTTDRRRTSDGKAALVSAAHPIWVSDQVRGAVIVEETGNAVLAERNRAFERLFNIVLAVLLIGSIALTAYATWLSSRIRRLRDDAERAIDEQGRVRAPLASSAAGDEIGDLSRSFSNVLARLAEYASYQEKMASRLSHELRTPVAVVRSSLDNLKASALPDEARVYMARAQEGLTRLTQILTRMTEAARLEQGLSDVERERFDLGPVVAGCVEGYRLAYPDARIAFAGPDEKLEIDGAPDLVAQMLDKVVANAVEFARGGAIDIALVRAGDAARLSVANDGPLLPEGMQDQLFDSMVSVRQRSDVAEPHLGLGLYIVRVIAEFHRGAVRAANRGDGRGVVVTVTLPLREAASVAR
jgi:dedicated sortase system histidine kinase